MSNRSRNNRRRRERIQVNTDVAAAIARGDASVATLLAESIKHYGTDTVEEARKAPSSGGSTATRKLNPTANKSLSVAWDESEALGIPSVARREGLMSDRDRKDTLYKAWLGNVWISAAIDVIAKRITSGGVHIKEAPGIKQGEGDEAEFALLNELVNRVNDDEDFLYLVRGTLTDIGIFGESYWELVPYVSPEVGKTLQLVKIDCITMSYKLAPNGQIVGYEQNMDRYQNSVKFTAEEVVRWWLPDPRASKKALSPIERILGPTDADSRMQDWTRLFFKRGARPNLWIEFLGGKDEAERFIAYLRENYTGQLNAHVPLVTYEGAKVHEIGKGTVDVDFVKGREMARQEVLAAYLVPPALVGIIESGNIGGGTGESQDKSLQYNACDPLKSLFLEKFNFRVVKKGLGVKSWVVDTHYGDYRSDDAVAKIQDTRIRNGSSTINETRAEMGREPVAGGDTSIVVASKDIQPTEILGDMAANARQQTDLQQQQLSAQVELAKAQAERMKNPQPVPNALQASQNSNMPPAGNAPQNPSQNKPQAAQESLEAQLERALAGVDVARTPPLPETALQHALSDVYEDTRRTWRGPSLDQLHIEQQMITALTTFMKSVTIGDGGTVQIPAMASLTQSIADWLEQAHALGVAHATSGAREALSLPKPRDWFGKAQQIMQSLVTGIADKVSELVDEYMSVEVDSGSSVEDMADFVNAQLDTWFGPKAEAIALYEIPAALENGVLQTFAELGVLTKINISQDGACPVCLANSEQGEVPLDQPFQSGDDSAPFHSRCRCSTAMGSMATESTAQHTAPRLISRMGACTCEICQSHHGKLVDEGKEPPYHDGCDCEAQPEEG